MRVLAPALFCLWLATPAAAEDRPVYRVLARDKGHVAIVNARGEVEWEVPCDTDAHDIAMLDPNSFGALNLGPVPGITNDFGRYSPQFRAADAACRHLLPAGVHDDGTGP